MADRSGEGRRRHPGVAALAAVLLAVGAALLVWGLAGQVPAPPAPSTSDAAPGPAPTGTGSPTPAPPRAAPDPSAVTQERTSEQDRTTAPEAPQTGVEEELVMEASRPTQLRVPALGIDAPLHALGLAEDGTLQVPSGERYDEPAWYDGSPTPGEAGPAVIEGHVTSQGSVPSVFFELGELAAGDRVEVAREDGSVAVFEVYRTESVPKDAFPTLQVFGNSTQPELRLITCGGEYDAGDRRHLDNVVVFARLADAA